MMHALFPTYARVLLDYASACFGRIMPGATGFRASWAGMTEAHAESLSSHVEL